VTKWCISDTCVSVLAYLYLDIKMFVFTECLCLF
jgi:hypothetical protein